MVYFVKIFTNYVAEQNIFSTPLPFTGEGQTEGAFSTAGQGEGNLQNIDEISPLVSPLSAKIAERNFCCLSPTGRELG
ncbi:hypothetical protein A1D22_03570 [Pasteurellaceae bacterium LFhippo2]|nr:hypothetical protein [Pasteurellaceae bacterium LFhippo2]